MPENYRLSEHFVAKEFVCRCGSPDCELSDPSVIYNKINPVLVEKLEQLRVAINMPITITSGARCQNKQIQIYKERYGEFWERHIVWDSQHLVNSKNQFNASDCITNYNMFKFVMMSAYFRFNGVGYYQRQLSSNELVDYFVHLDVGGGLRFYRKVYSF